MVALLPSVGHSVRIPVSIKEQSECGGGQQKVVPDCSNSPLPSPIALATPTLPLSLHTTVPMKYICIMKSYSSEWQLLDSGPARILPKVSLGKGSICSSNRSPGSCTLSSASVLGRLTLERVPDAEAEVAAHSRAQTSPTAAQFHPLPTFPAPNLLTIGQH